MNSVLTLVSGDNRYSSNIYIRYLEIQHCPSRENEDTEMKVWAFL